MVTKGQGSREYERAILAGAHKLLGKTVGEGVYEKIFTPLSKYIAEKEGLADHYIVTDWRENIVKVWITYTAEDGTLQEVEL